MQVISRVLAVVACVAVSVAGHAVITSPTPFNTNPSKTFGCGGASAGPLSVIPTGGTLSWKLVAGDGAGLIRMLVDPAGGGGGAFPTSYQGTPSASIVTVPLNPADQNPSVVGTTYDFTYSWPAGLTCTGSSGGSTSVCTVQVSSSSNWVSCFSFTKTAPTTSGSTGQAQQAQGNCVTITNPLTTCTMLTGKTVWVPLGSDINDLDGGVAATMTQNLPNERVFWAQPQSPDTPTPCVNSYKDYLCAQALIPCNAQKTQPTTAIAGTQPCQSVCKEFTCWCDLNDLHAFLYDCTTVSNANLDSVGSCSGYKRKYGPNNSTCVPRLTSSTAGTCTEGCGAAPHGASYSSVLVAAVVSVVAAALYANNH